MSSAEYPGGWSLCSISRNSLEVSGENVRFSGREGSLEQESGVM